VSVEKHIWLSPSAIPLQHLTTVPSMQLFPTERQVKAVGPTVFHKQKNGKPCARIGHILFSKRRRDKCFAAFRYIHFDVERVPIDPLNF
jgi:hypothetical protein